MEMTKAEFDLAERHMRDKFVVWHCQVCGSEEYVLGSSVYDLQSFSAAEAGENPLPIIAIICNECGSIQMVSARVVRI